MRMHVLNVSYLFALWSVLNCLFVAANDNKITVYISSNELEKIETTSQFTTLFLYSSEAKHIEKKKNDDDDKKEEDLEDQGVEKDMIQLVQERFPTFIKVAEELGDFASFGIVDLSKDKGFLTKWKQITTLPSIMVYKDAPKSNPYTGKLYREATVVDPSMLEREYKLKRYIKENVPSNHLVELTSSENNKKELENLVQEAGDEKVVLLVSKHKKPSHLFRALSTEFHEEGLKFYYLQSEEGSKSFVSTTFKLESLPSLIVMESLEKFQVLKSEKLKTYGDLKTFVENFTVEKQAKGDKLAEAGASKKKKALYDALFLNKQQFQDSIVKGTLTTIVAFVPLSEKDQFLTTDWRKITQDIQKKAGIAIGAVDCDKETSLCQNYAAGGKAITSVIYRVFPMHIFESGVIGRKEEQLTLEKTFGTFEEAKEAAFKSIPNAVKVLSSMNELSGFIGFARAQRILPVLLFTSKKDNVPIMFKSVALSFPTQKVAYAAVLNPDPQVKAQFQISPKASTALISLVPSDQQEGHEASPDGSVPFGVLAYDKKLMGGYTYPNVMRFLMNVLAQHPHPREDLENDQSEQNSPSRSSSTSFDGSQPLPYVTKENFESLCTSGNKICAIGFFENHLDTMKIEDSPLNKSLEILSHVAMSSSKAKEPFHFMWVNGKCQAAFAQAFEVGSFQMPTIVIYSPSKQRYATNFGLFDEENAVGFLKGILNGKIPTGPLNEPIPALVDECTFEDIEQDRLLSQEEEEEEDLGDLLGEILQEEQKQKDLIAEELKKEAKTKAKTKSTSKGNKKKKNKKNKKKKKKKNKNSKDEL